MTAQWCADKGPQFEDVLRKKHAGDKRCAAFQAVFVMFTARGKYKNASGGRVAAGSASSRSQTRMRAASSAGRSRCILLLFR